MPQSHRSSRGGGNPLYKGKDQPSAFYASSLSHQKRMPRTSERETDPATRTSARKAGMIAKQNLQAKKKLEAMLLRQEREKSKKAFKAAQAAQAAQRKEKLRCAEIAARQKRAAAAEKEAEKRKKNALQSNKGAQESQHRERSRRSVENVSRERKAPATAAKERMNKEAKTPAKTRGQALGLKIAHPTPRPIQFNMSQLASPSPSGQHVETDDIMTNALSCLSREVEEERDRPVLPKEDCPFSSEEQEHPVLTRVFF